MNPTGPLAAARAYTARMAPATCTITEPDPAMGPVWSDTEGAYVTPERTVYSGVCRLVSPVSEAREVQAGSRTYLLRRLELLVPLDVRVALDQKATVDSSPDPLLVGRPFRVFDVPKDDWTTWRSVVLEEES